MKKITGFIINGCLITASSLLLQLVDSVFTVYLSSRIGADGIGLFGLVTSVYRFAVTLSLSGINLAATKTISERLACGEYLCARKSSARCILLGLLFGLFSASLLFFLSPFISDSILGTAETLSSLRVLSLSLPFLGAQSALGGIFVSFRKPYFNVISGIVSFFVKIISSVALLSILPFSLENSCIAVSAGITASEIASFILSFIFYLFVEKPHEKKKNCRNITRNILSVSIPIALSSYVRSALSTTEQLLIPKGLMKYGKTNEAALGEYGLVKGMVLPVILMPSMVLYSFSGLLVPELAGARTTGKKGKTEIILSSVFSLTLIYSIAVCGILMFFAEDISLLLYKSTVPAGYIKILAPLCLVMYLDGAVDNILKGLGEQVYCMKINILDALLSLILVAVLVPVMGINGYVVVILASEIFNTFWSVLKLLRITEFRLNLFRSVLLPIFLIISSISLVSLLTPSFIGGSFIPSAVLSLVIYIFLCFAFSLFPKRQKTHGLL